MSDSLYEEGVVDNFNADTESLKTNTSIRHHPDVVRSDLARRILWLIFILSITLVIATIFGYLSIDAAKDLAIAIMAPVSSIFAATIGFFFGSQCR